MIYKNSVVLWFRREGCELSSVNNNGSTFTVQDLIDELEMIKNSQGADTKIFLGEQSGKGYGRLTKMRITKEEYEDENNDEE